MEQHSALAISTDTAASPSQMCCASFNYAEVVLSVVRLSSSGLILDNTCINNGVRRGARRSTVQQQHRERSSTPYSIDQFYITNRCDYSTQPTYPYINGFSKMRRYYICLVVLIILMSSLTKSDSSVNLKVRMRNLIWCSMVIE